MHPFVAWSCRSKNEKPSKVQISFSCVVRHCECNLPCHFVAIGYDNSHSWSSVTKCAVTVWEYNLQITKPFFGPFQDNPGKPVPEKNSLIFNFIGCWNAGTLLLLLFTVWLLAGLWQPHIKNATSHFFTPMRFLLQPSQPAVCLIAHTRGLHCSTVQSSYLEILSH